jgi:hypothetical protein
MFRSWGLRIGRLKLGLEIHRHVYGASSTDRWVIQPLVVYDRKRVTR